MGTPSLFEDVQKRIALARERVGALDVSDDVRTAALKQLTRLERAARSDLTYASREVEEFLFTLDAGEVPIYS